MQHYQALFRITSALLAIVCGTSVQAPENGNALPKAGSWSAQKAPTKANCTDAPWLQPLVESAQAGSTLLLDAGVYSGPVLMKKSLILDGAGKVVIDGCGKGTVFNLETNGAVLKRLTFTGSGASHAADDTCLNVRGNDNIIEDNRFEECLFGVDLKQSNRNIVRNNHIRSQNLPLGIRGDAIRLWYSMDNRIEGNTVVDSRDMVIWYSNGNLIARNHGKRGRYSLHFMYAQHNIVEDNRFDGNSVGIYVMYTDGVVIKNNVISHSLGATGMGIGFKEASDSILAGNDIIYCAIGISSDLSPFLPGSTVIIRKNLIAYNGIGMAFTGYKTGIIVEENIFEGNVDQVSQSSAGTTVKSNWRRNYWDDYQGFDQNHDGQGDTPYELYAFTDSIWMDTPYARFFKNTPLMELLDFLERLAPFSAPDLILRDETPVFLRPARETL